MMFSNPKMAEDFIKKMGVKEDAIKGKNEDGGMIELKDGSIIIYNDYVMIHNTDEETIPTIQSVKYREYIMNSLGKDEDKRLAYAMGARHYIERDVKDMEDKKSAILHGSIEYSAGDLAKVLILRAKNVEQLGAYNAIVDETVSQDLAEM